MQCICILGRQSSPLAIHQTHPATGMDWRDVHVTCWVLAIANTGRWCTSDVCTGFVDLLCVSRDSAQRHYRKEWHGTREAANGKTRLLLVSVIIIHICALSQSHCKFYVSFIYIK